MIEKLQIILEAIAGASLDWTEFWTAVAGIAALAGLVPQLWRTGRRLRLYIEEKRQSALGGEKADVAKLNLDGLKYADGRLTTAGAEALYGLFDKGLNRYQAAKAMEISYRAADLRHASWQKRKAKRSGEILG